MPTTRRLEGKVAIITGAASGIGAATTKLFVAEGARVMMGDLQADVGETVAAALGPEVAFRPVNVARESDVKALVEDTVARWGRVDCIFNNAGFGGALGPIATTTEDEFDLTFDVLVKGVFFGMKHAAPVMAAQGSGSIISTASVAGLEAGGAPHLYSAAKSSVIMLTRSVALEMAEHNVRVNCICPGYVATPLAAARPISYRGQAESDAAVEKMRSSAADGQPLRRVGEASDIASAALFLAGDETTWVTGTHLVVDGGYHAGVPWRQMSKAFTTARPIRVYNPAAIEPDAG